MPNRNYLIESQISHIRMQDETIKEMDQIIKNQHIKILDLQQQVSRWEIAEQSRNEEVYRKEGSI